MKAGRRPLSYLQDVPVALQRVHQRRVQRRHARAVGVLCHLVVYPGQLQQGKTPQENVKWIILARKIQGTS